MRTLKEMQTLEKMQEEYVPESVQELTREEMQWFRDAKFGMFIHWGLYSLLGRGEWAIFADRININEYAKLSEDFEARKFNAKTWAKTAKAAGMKYMVLTARHHDGFCLFDSKVSSYNSVNSAAKKDFVAEYVEACRSEGLKVGIYYSPMDWRFPGYFFPEMYVDSAMKMKEQCWEQLRELMTNYGKIDILWFDGEWLAQGGINWGNDGWYRDPEFMKTKYWNINYFWESEKLVNMIRKLQPGIMINNRCGWKGDFHVRERRIDGIRTDKPWDSNDCIAESWGWMPDKPILSLSQLIKNLVAIVVRDGNYLLNIGPTGSGDMDDCQVKRLEQLGQWLNDYKESIYGMRGGPFLPDRWGGSVYSGKTVYIHITEWVEDKIVLPFMENRLVSYSSPTSDKFFVGQKAGGIEIEVPLASRNLYDTIIKLDFEDEIIWDGVATKENDAYGLGNGI